MGIVTLPSFGSDPATVNAANLDGKVDPLATEFNGNIENANIASGANISATKLALSTIAQNITHSGTMTHSGTVTMSAKNFTEAKGADIASATTTECYAADGNFMHITGTTTITSLGTAAQAGDCRTLVFDGALTLTHNATSLILPTGANITTAAGDVAIIRAESTANTRVVAYFRKDGTALTGFTPSVSNALSDSVVQHAYAKVQTTVSGTTVFVGDDTIPLITEGNALTALDLTKTANNSSNLINIKVNVMMGGVDGNKMAVLYKDNTAVAVGFGRFNSSDGGHVAINYQAAAGDTSSHDWEVRFGSTSAGTVYVNDAIAGSGSGFFADTLISSIEFTEFKA